MEKLEKKPKEFREALEAEKDKTKTLDIKIRDAQKVVIDLTTRCQEYEKTSLFKQIQGQQVDGLLYGIPQC